jgi:predicted XRE-type DNA-binding protein
MKWIAWLGDCQEDKKMKRHITKGSVFDDLGFDVAESANLKIRAALMRAIEEELDKRKITQVQTAKILGVSQPRISDLRRGKIHLFTVDILVNMLAVLGKPVSLVIDDRIAA